MPPRKQPCDGEQASKDFASSTANVTSTDQDVVEQKDKEEKGVPSTNKQRRRRGLAGRQRVARHAWTEKQAVYAAEPKRAPDTRIVIVGAGIVGAATCFFLNKRGYQPTIVEKTGIACAASGKAGGFLARDWNGGALSELSKLGFDMHDQLASEFDNPWEYRRLNTISVQHDTSHARNRVACDVAPWVDGATAPFSVLGSEKTTAQVTPSKLTGRLVEECLKGGCNVKRGDVVGLELDKETNEVKGVTLKNGAFVAADIVIVCAGPWSHQLARWGVPQAPAVSGSKAYSVILKPKQPEAINATAVFGTYLAKRMETPEIYPRPDGSVFVVGGSDNSPLPEDPQDVQCTIEKEREAIAMAVALSSALSNSKPIATQACYLPISPDGDPVIGPVDSYPGLYMATGHSCWGILNGPATGLLISEMVNGDETTIDASSFSPNRFFTGGNDK